MNKQKYIDICKKLRKLDEEIDFLFIKYRLKEIHNLWFSEYHIRDIQKSIKKEFGFNFLDLRKQDFKDWYKELTLNNIISQNEIAKIMNISRNSLRIMRMKSNIFYDKRKTND